MEAALKREVGRGSGLTLAYSRPGLVTFKADRVVTPEAPTISVFARVWGRSVGFAPTPDDAAHVLAGRGVRRAHVFARQGAPDLDAWIDVVTARLAVPAGPAELGELVADVIVADGEPACLGLHRADDQHPPYPGGAIPVDVPDDAPSRAYGKIEEAIAWARLPVERGQVALEIGCAPGGALLALARRGLDVWGVDTGELAPHVAALPGVHHLRKKVGAVRWEDLPPRVDWLLVDVNLAPQVALHEVARLVPPLRASLRGAIITLKLNELSFVDALPELANRIAGLGFGNVRLRHLPSNRQEICAVAVRNR
jgi:23S rRNA (cytidine2498-2'-O)-methyltransferase